MMMHGFSFVNSVFNFMLRGCFSVDFIVSLFSLSAGWPLKFGNKEGISIFDPWRALFKGIGDAYEH